MSKHSLYDELESCQSKDKAVKQTSTRNVILSPGLVKSNLKK